MVAMTMGNDGPVHRPPGVNIEVASRTVQSLGACNYEVHDFFLGRAILLFTPTSDLSRERKFVPRHNAGYRSACQAAAGAHLLGR